MMLLLIVVRIAALVVVNLEVGQFLIRWHHFLVHGGRILLLNVMPLHSRLLIPFCNHLIDELGLLSLILLVLARLLHLLRDIAILLLLLLRQ